MAGRIEEYPYHWHDTLEIVVVLKGSVRFAIGDENLELQEDQIAAVNPGELHWIQSDADNEVLSVHIALDFLKKFVPDAVCYIYCCSAVHEARAPEKYAQLRYRLASLLQDYEKPGRHKLVLKKLAEFTYNFDFLRWGFRDHTL